MDDQTIGDWSWTIEEIVTLRMKHRVIVVVSETFLNCWWFHDDQQKKNEEHSNMSPGSIWEGFPQGEWRRTVPNDNEAEALFLIGVNNEQKRLNWMIIVK